MFKVLDYDLTFKRVRYSLLDKYLSERYEASYPVEVSILRDTGASQSLLLRKKLPKGVIEATRETVMIEGIGGKRVKIPLCKITLKSQWKNGPIQVGVVDKLPMRGISLILGNEIETKRCHPKKVGENERQKGRKKDGENERQTGRQDGGRATCEI